MAYLGNSPINRLYSSQAIALTQGQTAVNVSYTPGLCLVFKNGALLDPGTDYTATNGSVITLANAASTGDVLRVLNLAQFAVANALALSGGTLGGPLTGPTSASEANAGLIKIATTALAQALTDDTTALTPKKLAAAFGGGNQSLVGNGYQKLPGGLILQWGRYVFNFAGPGTLSATITLPTAFPSALTSILAVIETNAPAQYAAATSPTTASSFVLYCSSTAAGSPPVDWFAIGH